MSFNFRTQNHPEIFYRIYDDDSVSQRGRRYGFRAGAGCGSDANAWFYSKTSIRAAVELHADWTNRVPTPFISTSTSAAWILRQAQRREKAGKENVTIVEINADADFSGDDVNVYSMKKLVSKYGADIPNKAMASYQHEWLFRGRIPMRAIVEEYSAEEFEEAHFE
ncbi:hypothetical protein BDD12DRAFT_902463 [Trichophaea hybrida]|nr:hypothetical protein BDD12DRAFT_902463 [Trichophaea hybrida]